MSDAICGHQKFFGSAVVFLELIRVHNRGTTSSLVSGDPVARITYLHTGGVLSRKSGGRHVPLLYTILLRF